MLRNGKAETAMRLLLISYYSEENAHGSVQRIGLLIKFLKLSGHHISLVTSSFNGDPLNHSARIMILDPSFNLQRTGWRRLPWLFLRLAVETLNRIGIYASIYSFWKRAVLKRETMIMSQARPDAILATYPPLETLEIGLHLSRKYQLPLIADFRDGLLFEPVESKRLRRFACVRKAYAEIEHQTADSAAALVTVSEPLSDYFRRAYGHDRLITVANGFDPEENVMTLPEVTLEPGCFHIVHTGRFALSDAGCDITPLVQAMQELLAARPDLVRTLRLHLLGDLSRREKRMLLPLARRGAVRIHGAVDRMQALAFQRRADLLLLVTDPNRSSVATGKIFEYLQARRPILALTGPTFAAEIIGKTRSGWVVSPQDRPQIARAFERIVLDPAFYQDADMSPGAIEAYSFVHGCRQLSGVLSSLAPR